MSRRWKRPRIVSRRSRAVPVLVTLLLCLAACQDVQPPHMVSTPTMPAGPTSGDMGQSLAFTTSGASCSQGHTVQYRFAWGDGTFSGWGASTSASKSYASAGTYQVQAQARCVTTPSVVGEWSISRAVVIGDATPPPSGCCSFYVASVNSEVFHRASCSYVAQISSANKVCYCTRGEAIGDGKRPCTRCNP